MVALRILVIMSSPSGGPVHSRLQSLLVCLSFISVGYAGERVVSAQPTPPAEPPADPAASETPAPAPAENPPADPAPAERPPPAPAKTPPVSPAAPSETVMVSGFVRSPDLEAPLSGATVTVEGTTITATSDETGRFQLQAPPGKITLRADFNGFRSVQQQITVSAGKPADVDFPMSLDQLLTEAVVILRA